MAHPNLIIIPRAWADPALHSTWADGVLINLKKPEFNIQKEGIVVVEITVDRNGKVISATPGAKGSTLVDNTLYAAAKKAALESAFNVKSDAT